MLETKTKQQDAFTSQAVSSIVLDIVPRLTVKLLINIQLHGGCKKLALI